MLRRPHHPDHRSPSLPGQHASVTRWVCTAVLVATLAGWMVPGTAQTPAASAAAGSAAPSPSKPLWRDLSTKQQLALQPLAADWNGLSEGHKRKWLTLSRNYAKLSATDKQTLHSRMTEWTALSQQERAQARFNFAEVKQVPPDQRKAKWEAYQALTPEEKRRLADSATGQPPGAAAAIRPVPAQKLAPVPQQALKGQHSARIQLTPPAETATATPAPMMVAPSAPVEAPTSVSATPAASGPAPPPRRTGMVEPPSSAP